MNLLKIAYVYVQLYNIILSSVYSGPENLKKSRQKKHVKLNKSIISFRKIAFFALFPSSKNDI